MRDTIVEKYSRGEPGTPTPYPPAEQGMDSHEHPAPGEQPAEGR